MAARTTAGLSGRGWSLATATVGKIIQGQEAYGETSGLSLPLVLLIG